MKRDDFTALPASLALGLVYDLLPQLANTEAPVAPRAPRFDSKLPRKGGMFCWASEVELASLIYWHDKSAAGTEGKYAEKNLKNAKALSYWVAYRRACPTEPWSGEREQQPVRASAPSRNPQLHAWKRGGQEPEPTAPSGGGFADADYGSDDSDDSIPF